ncbi:MAG: hypothetical protein COB51_04705 [Moraxellaceae bacterium]|nr:MAG: hypothetical protein COB51_04705 [Moraxellaceae bacterium]
MDSHNLQQELELCKTKIANLEQYKNLFFTINDKYITAKDELDQLKLYSSEISDIAESELSQSSAQEYKKLKNIAEKQSNIVSQLQKSLAHLEAEESTQQEVIKTQFSQLDSLNDSIGDYQLSISKLKDNIDDLEKENKQLKQQKKASKPVNKVQTEPEIGTPSRNQNNNNKTADLEKQLEETLSASFEHMMNNADLGAVILFLINSYDVNSYEDLAAQVFKSTEVFDLDCTVQIHIDGKTENFSQSGPLRLDVVELFDQHKRESEVWIRKDTVIINRENISLLINKMPFLNEEKKARTRDNIKALTQGANQRLNALKREFAAKKQQKSLRHLIKNTAGTLTQVEKTYQKQNKLASEVMSNLLIHLNQKDDDSKLTDQQALEATQQIIEAKIKIESIYQKEELIDQQFLSIIKRLYTGYLSA